MKRSQIADLQSSLQLVRDQLQQCRTERVIFEQQMDVNSCHDHRVLSRFYNDETKLEGESKIIEQKLLAARTCYNLFMIGILFICLIIATLVVELLFRR
jgi:hypothetical protein